MRRVVLPLLWVVGLALVAALAIPASRGEVLAFDESVFEFVRGTRTPELDVVLMVFTYVGGGTTLVPLTILTIAVLARRAPRRALWLLAYAVGVVTLEVGGKTLVGRPRPLIAAEYVVDHGDLGFPSGHAIASTALYGLAALALCARVSSLWIRFAVLAGWLSFALTVCLTRVYYGAHWPSDVLGGFLLGGTLLSIAWSTGAFRPRRAA